LKIAVALVCPRDPNHCGCVDLTALSWPDDANGRFAEQQETVMDKFETRALSDDELNAVSGGDGMELGAAPVTKANQNEMLQAEQAAQNKQVDAATRGFKSLVTGIT
jgi:hypothetical protein